MRLAKAVVEDFAGRFPENVRHPAEGDGMNAARRAKFFCLRWNAREQQFSILSHAAGCAGLMSMIMISFGILPATFPTTEIL
jgi:hypothetical protein